MKKDNRKIKFECKFGEKDIKTFTHNCYFFGCIHQINGDCPIIKEDK